MSYLNPSYLNTTYNKSVYVTAASAVVTVLLVVLKRFDIELSGEEAAAVTGVVSLLINLFVPNKNAPDKET